MGDAHPTPPHPFTVSPRALTILELLIVLAILIAMGAMIAPAMVGVLRERALDSAAEVVSEQLLLARAHAQHTGRPVEVAYRPDPPRIVAKVFAAGMESISAGDRRAAEIRGMDDAFASAEDSADTGTTDEDAMTWQWARRTLPTGIGLSSRDPLSNDSSETAFGGIAVAPAEDRASNSPSLEDGPIRLAVFLPDGSALLTSPVWFISIESDTNGDRTIKLTVNSWTGLPVLEEQE